MNKFINSFICEKIKSFKAFLENNKRIRAGVCFIILAITLGLAVGGCTRKLTVVNCGDGTYCPAGYGCVPDGEGGFTCAQESCGDGVVNPGEECDDGEENGWGPNQCRPTCVLPTCGDGVVDDEYGEICDDGNHNINDSCPDGPFGTCLSATCGDGFIWNEDGGDETCDDGNDILHDDCPSGPEGTCRIAYCGDGILQQIGSNVEQCDCGDESYFEKHGEPAPGCTTINSDEVDSLCRTDCTFAGCGDGILDAGEECDMGEFNSDTDPDACRTDCTLPVCGDGVVDSVEECDDGAMNSDTQPDSCRNDCMLPSCGDGVVDSGEECDDGLMNSDTLADSCRTDCRLPFCGDGVRDADEGCDCGLDPDNLPAGCSTINSNQPGTNCLPDCTSPTCGDGIVDPGEECDCGEDPQNLPPGCLSVNSDTIQNACRMNCVFPYCGDGVVDAGEECDGGGVDTVDCDANCTFAVCGDGHVNEAAGESCDCGMDPDNLPPGCDNVNSDEIADACRLDCSDSGCGDDVLDEGEECDTGGDDTAAENGELGCNGATCEFSVCGDGYHNAVDGEECDNGPLNSDTEPDACREDCRLPWCGDDVVDTGEECDEGSQNSDSIPNRCRTNCLNPYCGDGVRDQGEECDDGAANSDTEPNACRTDCTNPSCGDGVVDTGEECDDGAANSNTEPDACRMDCTSPSCGDGVVDTGEDCDGTNLDGQTCGGLNYYGGTLSCTGSCEFDLSDCEDAGWCGDEVIQSSEGEECDGTNLGGESCQSLGYHAGTLSCTGSCEYDIASCVAAGICGDGTKNGPEDCDGDDFGGETCETLGYYGGTLSCTGSCDYDLADCEAAGWCGDGVIQSSEEDCDMGELGGETCETLGYYGGTLSCTGSCDYDLSDCEAAGMCGDGAIQSSEGEECDGEEFGGETCESLGYYGGTLNCTESCEQDLTDCEAAGWCGDGTIQSSEGEECDGEEFGGETCESLGYYGGTLSCTGSCDYDLTDCEAAGMCGDGVIQSSEGEECDGEELGGETCESRGFGGGTLGCNADCTFDESNCTG